MCGGGVRRACATRACVGGVWQGRAAEACGESVPRAGAAGRMAVACGGRRWARSGAWLVVSPAARSTERSVTRGVTDQPLQPLQVQDRCVLGMRPVRGISDRAPLKPQSKDRSLCVRRRVLSQAGRITRAYLRNAGTYWSYERALLFRIPEGVPHVIAAAQRASVSHAASTLLMTGGWSSSTPSLSRTISEWQPKRQQHNRIVRVSINGDSFWRLEQLNTSRNLPSR